MAICYCGEKVKHMWVHEKCAIKYTIEQLRGTAVYFYVIDLFSLELIKECVNEEAYKLVIEDKKGRRV